MERACGDPAQYDIIINMMAADDYGVVVYSRLMGADSYGGGQETINFIKDAELQRLITECNSAAGHTDENTQALHDYVIEDACGCGLFVATSYNVCRSTIKEVTMSLKFLPMPGAFSFGASTRSKRRDFPRYMEICSDTSPPAARPGCSWAAPPLRPRWRPSRPSWAWTSPSSSRWAITLKPCTSTATSAAPGPPTATCADHHPGAPARYHGGQCAI